jgi:hypothetical protein
MVGKKLNALTYHESLSTVIWGFVGDFNVVGMAFTHSGIGNSNKLGRL